MVKKLGRSELENGDNGQGMPSIQNLLQAIAQNQQELSDRLSDIEEKTTKKEGGTGIHIAEMFFKPDDKYLPDFSWISALAAKPFAIALTLDKQTDESVRSGKVSLTEMYIYNLLHLYRGVGGRLMHMGKEALEQQVSAEATKAEEEMPEFEAGRE